MTPTLEDEHSHYEFDVDKDEYILPPGSDDMVTVCSIRPDGTQHRVEMRLSEYYNQLDSSKQFQLCSVRLCGHDIEMHAAVKDYKTKLAGRCSVHGCSCKGYKPGKLVSKKELDTGQERIKTTIGFPWQPTT